MSDNKSLGIMGWFAVGAVTIAILVGVMGAVSPKTDNRVISNSYNNNTLGIIAVPSYGQAAGTINTTSTTNMATNNSAPVYAGNSDNGVMHGSDGSTMCWDSATNSYKPKSPPCPEVQP